MGSLFVDPLTFFAENKYFPVEQPQDGDIILYACKTAQEAFPIFDDQNFMAFNNQRIANPPFGVHVGIYENNLVLSKFGRGHVYRHALEIVPTRYSTEVHIFRELN